MKQKIPALLIASILVGGLLIRTVGLPSSPPLQWDEMFFGYSAYSVLQTGADEHAVSFPLIFKSIGDYKLALFGYYLIPFIKVFGLNAFALRLASGLAGLVSVYYLYKYAFLLTNNKKIATISAITLLYLPWHILFSRTANESILQLLAIQILIYYWEKAVKYPYNKKFILLASLAGTLSIWVYYSSLVFVPVLAIVYLAHKRSKKWQIYVPAFMILISCAVFIFTQPLNRINQTSIFSQAQIALTLAEAQQEQGTGSNVLLTRIMYNKVTIALYLIAKNYAEYFTLEFLVFTGDHNYARYSLPNQGPLYFWMIPFLCLAVIKGLTDRNKEYKFSTQFIIVWLLISSSPAAFSNQGTNVQRTIMAVIPITLLTGLGIFYFYNYIKQQQRYVTYVVLLLCSGVVGTSLLYFLNSYFIRQMYHQPWVRQPYAEETVKTLSELSPKYKQTVIANAPYAELFFTDKTDPRVAQQLIKNESYKYRELITLRKYKSFVVMPNNCSSKGKRNVLYLCNGDEVPYNSKILKVIRYPNDIPARIFLEFTSPDQVTEHQNDRIKVIPESRAKPQIIPEDRSDLW